MVSSSLLADAFFIQLFLEYGMMKMVFSLRNEVSPYLAFIFFSNPDKIKALVVPEIETNVSKPQPPQPAKLVIGLITANKSQIKSAIDDLILHFGDIDIMSPWMDFNYTQYYETEMGAPLFRRMVVHKKLIRQKDLAGIKLITNRIEKSYESGDSRCVNIDPGYLLQERFVLATGKNFSHRIYLENGIYADLTLIFKKKGYQSLEWTYPDYSSKEMKDFLGKVREKYRWDLKLNANDGMDNDL